MSNVDNKTYRLLFIESLEKTFVTGAMVADMIERWKELGKPLFMVVKEFRERIFATDDSEIKLNFSKWLQPEQIDVDVFEIMCMLILYSRSPLKERINLLFQLFCYNNMDVMSKNETVFLFNKVACAIASTLCLKKQQLLEVIDPMLADLFNISDENDDSPILESDGSEFEEEAGSITLDEFETKLHSILKSF